MKMKVLTDARNRHFRANERATVDYAWHAAHLIYNKSLRRKYSKILTVVTMKTREIVARLRRTTKTTHEK